MVQLSMTNGMFKKNTIDNLSKGPISSIVETSQPGLGTKTQSLLTWPSLRCAERIVTLQMVLIR